MIRRIIALCLVLMFVSTAFTGCGKKDEEPKKPDTSETKDVDGHDHDADDGHEHDAHAGHDHD